MVGKLQLDVAATVKQYARADPKVTVPNQNRLRGMLRFRMGDYLLVTTPDEKVFVKGTQKPLPGFGNLLTQLFQVPVAPPPPTNQPPTLFTGTWKKEGEKYQISITTEQGEKTADANFVDNGKLSAAVGPNTLVFTRID